MDGAGRIRGDLTPECAAAVTAVLEALGKRRGPEDFRTIGQRYHDALQEGCELLIRAKMVPDRAGADTRVDVTIPLSDLLGMDGASVVEDTWLRARAGEHGYLTGKDAEAAACDALIVPIVTGAPDWDLIAEMITLVTEAYNHASAAARDPAAARGVGGPAVRPRPPRHPVRLRPRRPRLRAAPHPARQAPQHQKRHPRRRLRRHHPRRDPQGRHRPRQGLRLARRLQPPTGRLRRPPRQAQTARRQDQQHRLRHAVSVSTMTSASTGWAGKSNSCPTDPPAPPAPTGKTILRSHGHHPPASHSPNPANDPARPRPQPDARDRKAPHRPRAPARPDTVPLVAPGGAAPGPRGRAAYL